MKRIVVSFYIGLFLFLSVLSTYAIEPSQSMKGKVRISGAWALYPMMVTWGEEFRKVYPNVRIDISAGGAGKGIADALAGMVDIGMVSRDIRPEEIKPGTTYVPHDQFEQSGSQKYLR
jgi:phosphate transport system substrate-binding protein